MKILNRFIGTKRYEKVMILGGLIFGIIVTAITVYMLFIPLLIFAFITCIVLSIEKTMDFLFTKE